MADEGGDWFAAGGDAPPPKAAAASADTQGEVSSAPTGEKREVAEDEFINPHKILLFKHWKRPMFLQYKYLYDYRYNYYDDVLDYLDKRQRGLRREVPHPQTWAERALRTYNSQINKVEKFRRYVDDTKLVTQTKISGAFQLHHSKSYINKRYSSILA